MRTAHCARRKNWEKRRLYSVEELVVDVTEVGDQVAQRRHEAPPVDHLPAHAPRHTPPPFIAPRPPIYGTARLQKWHSPPP
eukprot:3134783-Rhodomonas_salina.1